MKVLASLFRVLFSIIILLAVACYVQVSPTIGLGDFCQSLESARIMEMLSTLTEQEAKLVSLRYGLEGGLPLSPEAVGEKLGLTAEEVVTMEAAALSKLRQDS